jgi:hypothetical protein
MAWPDGAVPGRSRTDGVIPTLRACTAALCVALVSTACTTSQANSSTAAPSSGPATAATTTPADPATLAAISSAYEVFFASTSTTAQSQAALQHGERFTKTLTEQAKSDYAKDSSASVGSARLISPEVATVTFTINTGDTSMLNDAPGYAVRSGNTWQVAAQTFCGLLTLQGDAPDACNDPAVTALPH